MKKALELLKSHQVVGMPTETVYGLAASIHSLSGLKKIFSIKERPFYDPLIVHVCSLDQARSLVLHFPKAAEVLANKFWPGPLTLVLEKSDTVSDLITSGLSTVAIRMPKHPLALELIQNIGHPLAAPSANKFKKTSPTKAQHVIDEFGEDVYVLDGGDSEVGIESTIISLRSLGENEVIIKQLRPGSIVLSEITEVLQRASIKVDIDTSKVLENSPGNMKHHYMPKKPLIMFDIKKNPEAKLPFEYSKNVEMILSDTPEVAARELYAKLRECSKGESEYILFTKKEIHSGEKWESILDRLKKAASILVEV